MQKGFILTTLRLAGASLPYAEINFKKGLNVITGPTNTGKSYIYECIKYMLGSSTKPRDIIQARDYKTMFLEIMDCNGLYYTLKSDIRGGGFFCYKSKLNDVDSNTEFVCLSRKHNPKNENTVSAFFLKLNNLYKKQILIDRHGKVRDLSYRDIVRYLMVQETNIITDKSIIISENKVVNTAETSTLRLIVTGGDDSDIIPMISTNKEKNIKGKIELLSDLIQDTEKIIPKFDLDIEEQISQVELNISKCRDAYIELNLIYNNLYKNRNIRANQLIDDESQLKVMNELLLRSDILNMQYESDIDRLTSTVEASYLFIEDNGVKSQCPICNNLINKEMTSGDIHLIIDSCKSEINKIMALQKELQESHILMTLECHQLNELIKNHKTYLEGVSKAMGADISKDINTCTYSIQKSNDKRSELKEILFKRKQLDCFIKQKKEYTELISTNGENQFKVNLSTANMSPLSTMIKDVLIGCVYPNLSGVSYSEDKKDFVISGEDRSLEGKGFRAITYSAFIIGLQKLLSDNDYTLGVPILDSPFVTYKKPGIADDDLIPEDIAMNFYNYLANAEFLDQTIIFENLEPLNITSKINHIVFTASQHHGRFGFIPHH